MGHYLSATAAAALHTGGRMTGVAGVQDSWPLMWPG